MSNTPEVLPSIHVVDGIPPVTCCSSKKLRYSHEQRKPVVDFSEVIVPPLSEQVRRQLAVLSADTPNQYLDAFESLELSAYPRDGKAFWVALPYLSDLARFCGITDSSSAAYSVLSDRIFSILRSEGRIGCAYVINLTGRCFVQHRAVADLTRLIESASPYGRGSVLWFHILPCSFAAYGGSSPRRICECLYRDRTYPLGVVHALLLFTAIDAIRTVPGLTIDCSGDRYLVNRGDVEEWTPFLGEFAINRAGMYTMSIGRARAQAHQSTSTSPVLYLPE